MFCWSATWNHLLTKTRFLWGDNPFSNGWRSVKKIVSLQKFHLMVFDKFEIPQDWIYQQMLHCSTPLHPLIPPLLETFVHSSVVPTEVGSKYHRNQALTEQEILSVFGSSKPTDSRAGKGNNLTSQLLMLYYLLLYEDCLLTNTKQLGKFFERLLSPVELLCQFVCKFPRIWTIVNEDLLLWMRE